MDARATRRAVEAVVGQWHAAGGSEGRGGGCSGGVCSGGVGCSRPHGRCRRGKQPGRGRVVAGPNGGRSVAMSLPHCCPGLVPCRVASQAVSDTYPSGKVLSGEVLSAVAAAAAAAAAAPAAPAAASLQYGATTTLLATALYCHLAPGAI